MITQKERTIIRRIAGLAPYDSRPVEVIEGDKAPCIKGESYYFTTPSGKTIVNYPNAYGWPTRYHPSTRRVEVGQEWIKNNLTI